MSVHWSKGYEPFGCIQCTFDIPRYGYTKDKHTFYLGRKQHIYLNEHFDHNVSDNVTFKSCISKQKTAYNNKWLSWCLCAIGEYSKILHKLWIECAYFFLL